VEAVVKRGSWVQIHRVILPPGQRAPQVPEETQRVPLELWAKGFLDHDARLGDEVTIRTIIGREMTGCLLAVNPRYEHDFGSPIPELLTIGPELREFLAGRRPR
jgi:hypothetical protein